MPGNLFGPQNQDPAREGATATPGSGEGASGNLPEEFQPYKNVLPWEQIPEAIRQEALKGVKEMHGSRTKAQQEAAQLRQANDELQEKARMLDFLMQDPTVQRVVRGEKPPEPPNGAQGAGGLEQLSEYGLDPQVGTLLKQAVTEVVKAQLAPVQQQLATVQGQVTDTDVRAQLRELTAKAQAAGLPDPTEHITEMRRIVSSGRARNLEDAYNLALQGDMPKLLEERIRKQLQEEMAKKADLAVPPGQTPAGSTQPGAFLGDDADVISEALKSAQEELGITFQE